MDVAALILAVVAAVLFFVRPSVNLGLAVLAVVFICQWVHLTGHLVTVN